MNLKRSLVIAAMLVALALASLAPAVSSSTESDAEVEGKETMRIIPTDDTYVDNTEPDSNFGTELSMNVQLRTDYYAVRQDAILKIDLSAIPAGALIKSATLWTYYVSDFNADEIYIGLRAAGDNWDELTVTWDTRPVYGEIVVEPVEFLRGHEGWFSWDVTNFIQSKLNSGIASLYFYSDAGGLSFSSKDGGGVPI